jgi:hypothetical protein
MPVGALVIVLGWTIALLVLSRWNGVPLWVAGLAYGVPMGGVVILSFHIARLRTHTRADKRRLWLFFLTAYLLGVALFFLAQVQSTVVEAQHALGGEIGSGLTFVWIPLAILLPGIGLALYVITGVSPVRARLGYTAVLLGVMLFVVMLLPLPQQMAGDEVPEVARNIEPWDDTEHIVWVAPYWYYHLTRQAIGFIGVIMQLTAGITALIIGGLWSLSRPEQFKSAFGIGQMRVQQPAVDRPPEKEPPRLRLWGP